MNDRDVEAQPGDKYETDLEGEPLDEPAEARRLVMPRKADVARSDQARRANPARTSAPEAGARKRTVAQAHPITDPGADPELDEMDEPAAARVRLKSPHPLSRLRREERRTGLAASLGLNHLAASVGLGGPSGRTSSRDGAARQSAARQGVARQGVARRGAALQGVARRGVARLGRPHLFRPTLRGIFGLAGMTATFAVVTGLLLTLPTHPTAPAATGSIYGINWHGTAKPPAAKLDFGPYFTSLDNELLMLGSTISTTGASSSASSSTGAAASVSTTTVWSSTDGTAWTQRSVSGAFGIDGRRFVAQGISDDGQGGLVVIGNSLGSSPTDVIATAWHSRDGRTWTLMQVDSGGGQEMIAGVASRPGSVVAAGNGVAWLSTDGSTWTAQVLPGAVTAGLAFTPRAVGSWDGGFVIIGLSNGTKTTTSAVWYSSTGRDWKQATTSLAGFDVRGIAALGGTVVAVGIDLSDNAPALAASWSSTDGGTWVKSTAPTDLSTVAMDGVANVDGSLIAFGAPAPATTSATASAGPTLPGSTPVPASTEVVWVSENGLDWLPITSTTAPLTRAHMASIGNRVLMIGGASGGLGLVSGDLSLGKARLPASQSAPPAIFALTLKSGDTPMIVDVTKDFTMGPIASTRDRFFVFATGPSGTAIFSSPDGSLWSQEAGPGDLTAAVVSPQPVAPAASGSAPAASGSAPAASGSAPAASRAPAPSSAPIQAQTVITGRPVVLQAIPDGQGGIIATGRVTNSAGNTGMIWHLKAGNWQQVQFNDDAPPEVSSIAAGPGGFVASSDLGGGSQILYSTDGDTWQAGSIAVGSGFALSVATYRYGFVAVGTDPTRQGVTTAWTSPDGRTWTLRTDWHLPPNVTALFGMGNTLVAAANTAPPTASASSSASAAPSVKPSPTPAVPVQSSTWWWSATGVVWQQSGLQTSSGDWAIANGRILVVSAPATAPGNWTAWNSADGKSWQRPGSESVAFAGSRTCTIASIGDRVIIVGWDSAGSLKDYFGRFGGN
jgi:hypothetical protein